MKNIQAQYQDLLEGKMSKSNFMRNVRMQFPDYISPVNSYEDMVSILKSKRMLREGIQDHPSMGRMTDNPQTNVKGGGDYDPKARAASLNRLANFGPKEKAFYLVDDAGTIVDSTMATNAAAATQYFEDEFEMGIPGSMTVTDMNPEEIDEAIDTLGIEALRKGALREDDSELEAIKQKAKEESENGYVQHVNKGLYGYYISDWYDADETVASYENGIELNEDKTTLNEATEKTEGSYKKVTGKEQYNVFNEIDRVNPYEFKKGLAIEMGMQYEPTPNYFTDKFNPESVTKATKKVLKNLEKDPAYYTNMISLEFEKKSGMLQKPKEVKVKADGATKIKGFSDAKSNTETNLSKRERAKGSPDGVKEMKPSKKSMGGIKIMKSNDKLPKGVELMKEVSDSEIMKKYNEMMGKNPQTKFADVAKALNVPEDQVQAALATSSMPSMPKFEDRMQKIKEYVTQKIKKALKEKMRKPLEEEDPALSQLDKAKEVKEKELATILQKQAAILSKPGTQS